MSLCQLCGLRPAIKNSHVIPALVFRAIKSDSPTGFFRNPNNPNLRLQDGDKVELLCEECEQRFSARESKFADEIFLPFHNADKDHFVYGDWLHYFLTSIAWRTLALDLPGLRNDATIPPEIIADLSQAAALMQRLLLDEPRLGASIRNHAFVFAGADARTPHLAAIGPKYDAPSKRIWLYVGRQIARVFGDFPQSSRVPLYDDC